jgi:hypothetical protein
MYANETRRKMYEWMLAEEITVTKESNGTVSVGCSAVDEGVVLRISDGKLLFDGEFVDVGDNLPAYLGIFDAAELGRRVWLIGGAEGYEMIQKED